MSSIDSKLEILDQSITGLVVNLWDALDHHKDIPQELRTELTVIQHRLMQLMGFVRGMRPEKENKSND